MKENIFKFQASTIKCYVENDVLTVGIGDNPSISKNYLIITRFDDANIDDSIGLLASISGNEISNSIQEIRLERNSISIFIKPEKIDGIGASSIYADLQFTDFDFNELSAYLIKIFTGSSVKISITGEKLNHKHQKKISMNSIKTRAIHTKYGIIQYRDSLIIDEYSILLVPMSIRVEVLLSPSGCTPMIKSDLDVKLEFKFTKIKYFGIYLIDDYPYEKYLCSSFDEVLNNQNESTGRYILSTYDHVFDVMGEYEIIYN